MAMIRPAPRPPQNVPSPAELNAPGVNANACEPLKWENAAMMVASTAMSMITNRPVVSLPIWPIRRNRATTMISVMTMPMILPSGVVPAARIRVGANRFHPRNAADERRHIGAESRPNIVGVERIDGRQAA